MRGKGGVAAGPVGVPGAPDGNGGANVVAGAGGAFDGEPRGGVEGPDVAAGGIGDVDAGGGSGLAAGAWPGVRAGGRVGDDTPPDACA